MVLAAVNLGGDADTTGAMVGQLAGAYCGLSGIPSTWRSSVILAPTIAEMADQLLDRALRRLARG
jgi:ADP-ribosyl-[dinitrogen reductase] hydrolase